MSVAGASIAKVTSMSLFEINIEVCTYLLKDNRYKTHFVSLTIEARIACIHMRMRITRRYTETINRACP